jgi:antitoxin ParD1/3/4
MSSHAINDRFSLLTHHHYADRIRADPSLIAEATARVNGLIESGTDTIGHRMWRSLLVLDLQHVLKTMVQDDPDGRLLRSNSPFSRLIGYKDVSKRNLLWHQAKREVAATLRQAVAGGEYASTSEVVREALRGWTRHQDAELRELETFRAAIRVGLDSGSSIPADGVYAELHAMIAKRRAAQG